MAVTARKRPCRDTLGGLMVRICLTYIQTSFSCNRIHKVASENSPGSLFNSKSRMALHSIYVTCFGTSLADFDRLPLLRKERTHPGQREHQESDGRMRAFVYHD